MVDDDVDSLFREVVDDGQALHAPAVGKCRSSQSMLAVPKGVLAMFTNTASVVFCSA